MSDVGGPITSVRNPAVVRAARLHRSRLRSLAGQTLLEGPNVVAEAIRGGARIETLFGLDEETSRALAAEAGIALTVVTRPVLERLAGTETPRGPVAVIDVPESEIAATRRLLVAWGIADPGNTGTLLRSAAAFGYGFVSGPGSADPWSPKVLRSAAGAHFATSVGVVGSVHDLGERRLVGTIPRGGEPIEALHVADALVVGSEAHGLPEDVLAACDILVSIPMQGAVESLNAAVAGGIAAYLGAVGAQD